MPPDPWRRQRVGALAAAVAAAAAAAAGAYVLVVRGALTVDLGVGRRLRALGPLEQSIAAPPDTVFDVIAGPYLGRTPRAMRDKLQVLERGRTWCWPPISPGPDT